MEHPSFESCADDMECSIHRNVRGRRWLLNGVPIAHRREIQAIFPDLGLEDMLIVPTCQRTDVDLVNFGDHVEEEKDLRLERFMAWAKEVCSALNRQGYWCDYIDPCSGLPMIHTHYQQPYSEIDGLIVLCRYKVANAGCCKVVLHPKWGSSVYPASLFAKAPHTQLQEAIQDANALLRDGKLEYSSS